ncbi:MAG TPA: fibronectin type III domain-containing protein [Polyangia bacterium]
MKPRLIVALLGSVVAGAAPGPARACRILRYDFEPDCLRRDGTGTCRFDLDRPDFGPQLAVWIESADGSRFVDTAMVTNAVGLYGIGNRPGRWDFRSGPRFPYGRRPMALPVWAHRRGKTYPAVVMGDGNDDAIAAHMAVSSPEPHFCRPMMASEVVDAVTCASGLFRSSKGVFDPMGTTSYYPPRADLVDWADLCVPLVSSAGTSCDYGDARQFGLINDLDAVAAATPRYDALFEGTWAVPPGLADGDYALMIEVGKEFDADPAFSHPAYLSPYETVYYDAYGTDGNVGQPSVVYRLPFRLGSEPVPATAAVTPTCFGDWTGATGDCTPLDDRITDGPGSGGGRLRLRDGAGGSGRVHLVEGPCTAVDCSQATPLETPPLDGPVGRQGATSASLTFRQVADVGGGPVLSYELRAVRAPDSFLDPVDEAQFVRWAAAPAPSVASPGTITTVTLDDLTAESSYVVGLRARGACGWSSPGFTRVSTGAALHTKLSGCVIATAALGSDLDPDVRLLRRERDWAAARSGGARLAALLYGDSAPPLAQVIARSQAARAIVRAILRPLVAINRALLKTDARPGSRGGSRHEAAAAERSPP